jgi:adenylate cyclase
VCETPFDGIGGLAARVVAGLHPSIINPHLCNYCENVLPPGGAEVDIAVLFADVRGSTELAEKMSAREFSSLMNRFYKVASPAVIHRRGIIDKLIGDEIMAFFIPANDLDPDHRGYRRAAVSAAVEILEAVGFRAGDTAWLSLAVGVHAGPAFVGKLGMDGVHSFSAIGDTVNTAARLRSEAKAGEILLGDSIYQTVAAEYPDLESREIIVKGKSEPLRVHSLRPADLTRSYKLPAA